MLASALSHARIMYAACLPDLARDCSSRIAHRLYGAWSRVGAAIFTWSLTDPYEQLSDAYTFMELRRARPSVGDDLYSTLRRPMLSLERDDAGHGIDLLRHDCWWPRDTCRDALAKQAKASGIPSPLQHDWPYALNVFARTRIGQGGNLIDDPVATTQEARIAIRYQRQPLAPRRGSLRQGVLSA